MVREEKAKINQGEWGFKKGIDKKKRK